MISDAWLKKAFQRRRTNRKRGLTGGHTNLVNFKYNRDITLPNQKGKVNYVHKSISKESVQHHLAT
jgi:hypothetical protein